jgi:hypothetical protein
MPKAETLIASIFPAQRKKKYFSEEGYRDIKGRFLFLFFLRYLSWQFHFGSGGLPGALQLSGDKV